MKHALPIFLLSVCSLAAQTPTMTCEDHQNGRNRQVTHCEIQERRLAPLEKLLVDGKVNGGIQVKAWNQPDILVRAMVQGSAENEGAARALYAQVIVHTTGGTISADGPGTGNWSASYEIFVPAKIDLNLAALNGGISITGVNGVLDFKTTNGGIHLAQVAGNVHGRTSNGGVHVELSGPRWNGVGLDVQSMNGGVHLVVPANYSAQFETGTVNGGFQSDFPVPAHTSSQRHFTMSIGAGGPPIRVTTTNGGIHISKVV